MKTIVLICCLATFISITSAAIGRIENATHPDHPNKCYYEGPPRLVMEFGTKKRISGAKCGAYSCTKSYTILIEYCGSVGSNDHCKRVPGNPSSPFPRCCDEYIC